MARTTPVLIIAALTAATVLGGCQPRDEAVTRISAALEKTAKFGDYNTLITISDRALEQAAEQDQLAAKLRGPLWAQPIVVKDNIDVAGLPTTGGTPALADYYPDQDAGVVARLREAGAIVLGKSNLHELAYGVTSKNFAYGAVHNAHDFSLIAGGSSGGTAVAIALGIVDAGLGTDTGGSTRIPAALNGIAGFRPTLGRYPSSGLLTISSSRDTAGPMAKDVGHLIALDAVMAAQPPVTEPLDLRGLRLGIPREYFYEGLEPAVDNAMRGLMEKLTAAGVELIEASVGGIGALNDAIGFPLVLYETGQSLPEFLSNAVPQLTPAAFLETIASPDVKISVSAAFSGVISQQAYTAARDELRPRLQALYAAYFERNQLDAALVPTTPLTARPIEESLNTVEWNGEPQPTFQSYIRNTDPSSNAGIPSLTLPLPVSAGEKAVGAMLDGPVGSDARLLQIGLAIELLLAE